MNITIEITKADLKRLVCEELQKKLGDVVLDASRVSIQTKSKQNYKSEWEEADFKAEYIGIL